MLYPNCSETTYKLNESMKSSLKTIKKIIMDPRIVTDIDELRVIVPDEFPELKKEVLKIIPSDDVWSARLKPSEWGNVLRTSYLPEVRKLIADGFEELVLLGEKYKKRIVAKAEDADDISPYYVILSVRWYPMDYSSDSELIMKFGEGYRDWTTDFEFENRGPDGELETAVKNVKKTADISLEYFDSS
jgi:hypothetical protein